MDRNEYLRFAIDQYRDLWHATDNLYHRYSSVIAIQTAVIGASYLLFNRLDTVRSLQPDLGAILIISGAGALLTAIASAVMLYRSASIQTHQAIPLIADWESWISTGLADQPDLARHESLRDSLIHRLSEAEKNNAELFERRMRCLKRAYQCLAVCLALTLIQASIALLPTIIGPCHHDDAPEAAVAATSAADSPTPSTSISTTSSSTQP